LDTNILTTEEAEEMGIKEVLFRKSDLKIAQEAHAEARIAVERFEAETEKITTRLGSAVAEKNEAITAFDAAEAEAVAAVARGEEMPDTEPHRQSVDRAERKVRTIEAAIEKRNGELKTLLNQRRAAYKTLLDERLRIEAPKLRAMMVAFIEQNNVIASVTNAECNHPVLTVPYISNDLLIFWDRAYESWANSPDGAHPRFRD
jgi:hypothetical protein